VLLPTKESYVLLIWTFCIWALDFSF